jgi:spore coat protein U-like protein
MKTKFRLALAAALVLFAAPALAQTASATFQVSATVLRTCQLRNVASLAFGTYDALATADLPGSTTFEFRCSRSTPYQIAIDNGGHFGMAAGFAGDRAMQGGTAFLAYRLFRDAARTQAWGATLGTNTLDGAATSSGWTTTTIYGVIPQGQDVAAQGYVDATVTITVNY